MFCILSLKRGSTRARKSSRRRSRLICLSIRDFHWTSPGNTTIVGEEDRQWSTIFMQFDATSIYIHIYIHIIWYIANIGVFLSNLTSCRLPQNGIIFKFTSLWSYQVAHEVASKSLMQRLRMSDKMSRFASRNKEITGNTSNFHICSMSSWAPRSRKQSA